METTNPPVKKSLGRRLAWISLWVVVVFMGLILLGYFLPHIAYWGFSGSVQVMEGRVDRLTLPAPKAAELRLYISSLRHFLETTYLTAPEMAAYVQASNPLEKVLRSGRVDDKDMQTIRQAFADAEIPVETPPAAPSPAPAQKK